MSWLASAVIALLTGLLGMFGSGFIAAMVVDWYNISGREGASGYFVVAFAILGFGAGVVIGLIVARSVASSAHPGFLRALGFSLAIVALIELASGGLARALADVPPTIDGERLLLAVEIRWPAEQSQAPTAVGPDEPSISLHSVSRFSHTVRVSQSGPLWMEDARRVDNRWVVPGAVEVFTSRGDRMLTVNTGEKNAQGFQIPLPAFPDKKNLEWSDWLPRFAPGVKVPANLLSYRYRAQKVSEPIRTETVGPFQIATIAYDFFEVQQGGRTLHAANARFAVRYRGQPLVVEQRTSSTHDSTERVDRFDNVALVGGRRSALLVTAGSPGGTGQCYLGVEDGQQVRVEYVAECGSETKGQELTSAIGMFRAAEQRTPVRGRIDRVSYDDPGLYRLGNAVVDTRQPSVHHFGPDSTFSENLSVPPFGLSPDERSFVTFGSANGLPAPVLLVTDFVDDRTYTLPVDPARMRYTKFEAIDPAWLDHHFEWRRGRDGVDRLIERPHFVPLPYHGELTVEGNGNRTYRLDKATEALRGALLGFLVSEFKGVRQAADSGAYEIPVTIGGRVVNVAFSSGSAYVSVSMGRDNAQDSTLVATIAERFDAALATGRYDDLFVK